MVAPSFKNHFTERKEIYVKTQLKKHTIEQKYMEGEQCSAGIANESKPLLPSRQEKGKGRKE